MGVLLGCFLLGWWVGADRSKLYFDLVHASLSAAARKALRSMDPSKYEYQSQFARRYVAQGRVEGKVEGKAEGRAEGRAELILSQLRERFGALTAEIENRVRTARVDEIDCIAKRVLTAASVEEALGA